MNGACCSLRRRLVACAATSLILIGCSGSNGGEDGPPTITVQPTDQTVNVGQTATFSVQTNRANSGYVWYRGDRPIPGATAATYTTPPVVQADDGYLYSVSVYFPTKDLVGPTLYSRPARLTVLPGFVPVAGSFANTGSMVTARSSHTATRLNDGRVLIIDGTGDLSSPGALTAEIYDPVAGTFSSVGGPRAPRAGHSATLLADGRVLIAGGQRAMDALASAELFDPATNTYTALPSMNTARSFHTATLLTSGRVLLAGGGDGNQGLTSAEVFEPVSQTFSTTSPMVDLLGRPQAVPLADGKVLVTGSTQYLPAVSNIYDPVTATWTRVVLDTSIPSWGRLPMLLPDGSVMLVGGCSSVDNTPLHAAQRFSVLTGAGLSGPSQVFARYFHSATQLPSGKMLVVGGIGEGRYVNRAELYDPATDSFSVTGAPIQERAKHSATLLANGSVLIAGGDTSAKTLGTAVVFTP